MPDGPSRLRAPSRADRSAAAIGHLEPGLQLHHLDAGASELKGFSLSGASGRGVFKT